MAKKPKKTFTVLLKFQGKTAKVEFFPAWQFGDLLSNPHEKATWRFRIRLDGKWYSPTGEKYVFFDMEAAFHSLAALMFGRPAPALPPEWMNNQRVAVLNGNVYPGVGLMRDITFTKTKPFLAQDGRWMVFVVGREDPVPVADCEVR
jgi:hypothetical protein